MARGRGFLWFVGVVVAAGFAARATLFDTWTVPVELGGSAEPTLGSGDVVLVGKRAGGGFGDLVRCSTMEENRPAIGRIAGLGGDVVETDGAALVVNGKRYESSAVCPIPRISVETPRSGQPVEITCDMVEMGGGRHLRGVGGSVLGSYKSTRTVPGDRVFLVSDDRQLHDDSRDFGAVRPDTCHQIYFRLWGKRGWMDEARRLTVVR